MAEERKFDYLKIGLKAGLEIHQQLDTGKLFCSCPGYLRSDKPDFVVHRKLHAVPGESGEVDVAAMHEARLNRDFVYQGYKDNTCLVDFDECPPYPINEKALDEALKIALLLNCEIYQTTQVMRKTVIDGSNTSGFQRTTLVAHKGYIDTSFGRVGIDMVALEEDAGRIVHEDDKHAVYKLDRLGIPLVEVATAPDMDTPEKIKEAALKIGDILRACKVRRGIGTIRQDLNISVKGHDRVEVKGFQDPRMMITTVNLEIERQLEDVKDGKKNGEVRNAQEDGKTTFSRPMPGEARMYPETDLPLLHISRDRINLLKKNLPKLRGEIREELKKKGVSEELIPLVVEQLDEFNVLMKVYDNYENRDSQSLGSRKPSADANLVAKMIALWPQEFSAKMKKTAEEVGELLNERVLERVLEALKEGKITDGDVKEVLLKIVQGARVEDAIKVERISSDDLEQEIAKIVKEKPGMRANAYMGMVIAKLGNTVDKRKAMEILNRIVK